MLSIQDRGRGIPSEDLPHIFERFTHGRNVSGRIAGSGIGLAAAQQIVAHSLQGRGNCHQRAEPRSSFPRGKGPGGEVHGTGG